MVQQRVIHVTVVLTVLLVPQVVHILQLLVLLEPMPVVQQRVKHVPPVLTVLRVRPVVLPAPRASIRRLPTLPSVRPVPLVRLPILDQVTGRPRVLPAPLASIHRITINIIVTPVTPVR